MTRGRGELRTRRARGLSPARSRRRRQRRRIAVERARNAVEFPLPSPLPSACKWVMTALFHPRMSICGPMRRARLRPLRHRHHRHFHALRVRRSRRDLRLGRSALMSAIHHGRALACEDAAMPRAKASSPRRSRCGLAFKSHAVPSPSNLPVPAAARRHRQGPPCLETKMRPRLFRLRRRQAPAPHADHPVPNRADFRSDNAAHGFHG